MTIKQVPEEVLDIAREIASLLEGDDCFNVVLEDGKIQCILCLQHFAKSYTEQNKRDFMIKFADELVNYTRNIGRPVGWAIKSAVPEFLFAMVSAEDTETPMEVAQMMLSWMSEVSLEGKEDE